MRCVPKRIRVIAIGCNGFARKLNRACLLSLLVTPTGRAAPSVNVAEQSLCKSIIGVDLDRPLQQRHSGIAGSSLPGVMPLKGAKVEIVSVEALGRLGIGARDFGTAQARDNGRDNAFGDAILKIEDVVKRTFEAVGPNVMAGLGLDQLTGDPHPVCRLTDAAFEEIAHPEF